jgi:peptidoglycan hydrolase-like protein with peptidoglycan-binding domain
VGNTSGNGSSQGPVTTSSGGGSSGGSVASQSQYTAFLEAEIAQLEKELAARATSTTSLGNSTTTQSFVFTKNLEQGTKGTDVTQLQQKLITLALGPAAQALAKVGATGYFGSVTKAAVIEYQKAKDITPAVGYFGPLTRASING